MLTEATNTRAIFEGHVFFPFGDGPRLCLLSGALRHRRINTRIKCHSGGSTCSAWTHLRATLRSERDFRLNNVSASLGVSMSDQASEDFAGARSRSVGIMGATATSLLRSAIYCGTSGKVWGCSEVHI
jgi:hypothetical protein